jgi:hypothetical protein
MLKYSVYFILILIFLVNCFSSKNEKNLFSKISLQYSLTIITQNCKVETAKDTNYIVYFDNYIIQKLPIHHIFNLKDDLETPDQETIYRYFVYKKDSKYGLWYDSLFLETGKKLLVDSFLEKKIYGTFDLISVINNYDFFRSTQIPKSTNISHVYIPKIKKDELFADSLYLNYSDELKNVTHSFSKRMDSITGLKLYKIELFFLPKYYEPFKCDAQKRQYIYEMNSVNIYEQEEKELTRFVKVHQQDWEKL